jgi:hypothetical protein
MAEADDWHIMEAIATAIAAVAASVTTYWAFTERREKIAARAAQAAAQLELKNTQRRAHAPFLKPSTDRFNAIYHNLGNGKVSFVSVGHKSLLSDFRDEVEAKDGDEVFFVVENLGASARGISVKLDGKPITLSREAEMENSRGRIYLVYPYEKSQHGNNQIISLSFESDTGAQDTHQYITRHGFRVLRRIDPKMP